jgi:hypothetical protein
MKKAYYDVTVEYTGTKTFRVYMQDGEPAAALGVIGENYYKMERGYNPIDEREELVLTSIVYGEEK